MKKIYSSLLLALFVLIGLRANAGQVAVTIEVNDPSLCTVNYYYFPGAPDINNQTLTFNSYNQSQLVYPADSEEFFRELYVTPIKPNVGDPIYLRSYTIYDANGDVVREKVCNTNVRELISVPAEADGGLIYIDCGPVADNDIALTIVGPAYALQVFVGLRDGDRSLDDLEPGAQVITCPPSTQYIYIPTGESKLPLVLYNGQEVEAAGDPNEGDKLTFSYAVFNPKNMDKITVFTVDPAGYWPVHVICNEPEFIRSVSIDGKEQNAWQYDNLWAKAGQTFTVAGNPDGYNVEKILVNGKELDTLALYAEVLVEGETSIEFVVSAASAPVDWMEQYHADIAQINEWANAYQQIDDNFPGFALSEAGAALMSELSKAIHEANQAVADALLNAESTNVYDSPLTSELVDKITGLIAAANDAQMALADEISAKYEENIADINALLMAYQQLVNEVYEAFPGYAVVKADEFAAANSTIMALYDAASQAMEQAYETGAYNGPSDEQIALANDTLQALADGMEALANEISAQYDYDMAAVNDLAMAYQQLVNEVSEAFPGYAELKAEEFTNANSTIMQLYDAANLALEQAFESGVYNGPSDEQFAEAKAAIQALADGMQVLADEISAKYDQDIAAVNDLAMAYQELVNEVDEMFPGYAVVRAEAFAHLSQAITALYDQVNTAIEEAFATGEYNGLTPDQVEATAEELDSLAQGLEILYDDILEQIYNDQATIEILTVELTMITGDYEHFDRDLFNAISDELHDLWTACLEAEKEAIETGVYLSPLSSEILDRLRNSIDEFRESADKMSSIQGLDADNAETIYFDLNGHEVANPVAGKAYIRVANGTATKIIKK